jgi:hypothetical protein
MADSPQAARASYCERKGRSPRQDGSENTRLNFPVMAFPRDSVEIGRHPQVCKNLQALKGLLRLVPNDFDKTASVIRFHYEGVGQRIEDRPRDNGGDAINGTRCFSPTLALTSARTASLSVNTSYRESGLCVRISFREKNPGHVEWAARMTLLFARYRHPGNRRVLPMIENGRPLSTCPGLRFLSFLQPPRHPCLILCTPGRQS